MAVLDEAETLVALLTPAEKALLLQRLVQEVGEVFPGIEETPGVCDGAPRIVRTRVPVWLLEQARRLGAKEADLLRAYPTLNAADLTNAWAFVRRYRELIDEQIRLNEAA